MRYAQIPIQTHRENPTNARSEGAALLVRAGYVSHSGEILPLGQRVIQRLMDISAAPDFFTQLELATRSDGTETSALTPAGSDELISCPSCGYAARAESAQSKKEVFSAEAPAPVENVLTPDCPTIESLAAFLNIPQQKTAKALMFTRIADSKFVFVVVRGDHTLSEEKLAKTVGAVRLATTDEIIGVGAVPGYASPLGIRNALIVVDDLIPRSPNLVAGANLAGYHTLNVNCGRDYTPEIVTDLVMAQPGEACIQCGNPLEAQKGWVLATDGEFRYERILFALAEQFHDAKGLTFPFSASSFDVYLMHVPGKTMDTLPAAEELYQRLQTAGFSVLFDDREDRAGVKFNDADLIGCPLRVTVGERALQNGMVELKIRTQTENQQIPLENVAKTIRNLSKE